VTIIFLGSQLCFPAAVLVANNANIIKHLMYAVLKMMPIASGFEQHQQFFCFLAGSAIIFALFNFLDGFSLFYSIFCEFLNHLDGVSNDLLI
jgi:hypothetical protein